MENFTANTNVESACVEYLQIMPRNFWTTGYQRLLPPAYEVRGKVMFSVCLFTRGGGGLPPSPVRVSFLWSRQNFHVFHSFHLEIVPYGHIS